MAVTVTECINRYDKTYATARGVHQDLRGVQYEKSFSKYEMGLGLPAAGIAQSFSLPCQLPVSFHMATFDCPWQRPSRLFPKICHSDGMYSQIDLNWTKHWETSHSGIMSRARGG
jgi:hypothetical protein